MFMMNPMIDTIEVIHRIKETIFTILAILNFYLYCVCAHQGTQTHTHTHNEIVVQIIVLVPYRGTEKNRAF